MIVPACILLSSVRNEPFFFKLARMTPQSDE
jgi:hypothetical protein